MSKQPTHVKETSACLLCNNQSDQGLCAVCKKTSEQPEIISIEDFTPQDLILELLRQVKNNRMDGSKIVEDLRANPDLWSSVWFSNATQSLILRDLPPGVNQHHPDGFLHVDTLHIMYPLEFDIELFNLCDLWNHDTFDSKRSVITGTKHRIFSMWWD